MSLFAVVMWEGFEFADWALIGNEGTAGSVSPPGGDTTRSRLDWVGGARRGLIGHGVSWWDKARVVGAGWQVARGAAEACRSFGARPGFTLKQSSREPLGALPRLELGALPWLAFGALPWLELSALPWLEFGALLWLELGAVP